MNNVYVVDILRTPVGKAPRGVFKHMLPDDLLGFTMKALQKRQSDIDWQTLRDVVIGCAMPEAEQGMNIARIASLLSGLPDTVPAMTINRFCSSGIQSIATAGSALPDGPEPALALAGGLESMSRVPLGGNKYTMNPAVFENENVAIAYGMGITAEKVAEKYGVSRECQDEFAVESHKRAVAAQERGDFSEEIVPIPVKHRIPDMKTGDVMVNERMVSQDEGPRSDTSYEKISRLKPVFSVKGTVTAGNTSQMSDGAGTALLANEAALKAYNLEPLGRLVSFSVAGVPPEVMGIGPVHAIPKEIGRAHV